VGFGSFADEDPKPLTDLVLESLRRTRQRGLLLTGWGGLDQSKLPDNIFAIESLPHDWLFPRVAASGCRTNPTASGHRAAPAVLKCVLRDDGAVDLDSLFDTPPPSTLQRSLR
jgi:sterol 3beta-glucosyltransferase